MWDTRVPQCFAAGNGLVPREFRRRASSTSQRTAWRSARLCHYELVERLNLKLSSAKSICVSGPAEPNLVVRPDAPPFCVANGLAGRLLKNGRHNSLTNSW
jgi:hypothetical protein